MINLLLYLPLAFTVSRCHPYGNGGGWGWEGPMCFMRSPEWPEIYVKHG